MKRAIIVSVRFSKDSETNEDNVWITGAVMPAKMKNGNLFYPQSKKIAVSTCAGAVRNPDRYTKYKGFKLGDVVNIDYALNEFNQKPIIVDVQLVQKSPFKEEELIV